MRRMKALLPLIRRGPSHQRTGLENPTLGPGETGFHLFSLGTDIRVFCHEGQTLFPSSDCFNSGRSLKCLEQIALNDARWAAIWSRNRWISGRTSRSGLTLAARREIEAGGKGRHRARRRRFN